MKKMLFNNNFKNVIYSWSFSRSHARDMVLAVTNIIVLILIKLNLRIHQLSFDVTLHPGDFFSQEA